MSQPNSDSGIDELEERIVRAIHDPQADVELLAHEVAASDHAQAYLVELVETLSAVSPTSAAITRATALLEHGLAVAAEHGTDEQAGSSEAGAASSHGIAQPPDHGRRR